VQHGVLWRATLGLTGLFHHVLDPRYWTKYNMSAILPPEVRRPPGYPPYVRIRGTIDEGHEGHEHNRCSVTP